MPFLAEFFNESYEVIQPVIVKTNNSRRNVKNFDPIAIVISQNLKQSPKSNTTPMFYENP